MAGSLNHIVADDGTFQMDLIENMRDAHGALEECHQIIAVLLQRLAPAVSKRRIRLNEVLDGLGYPAVAAAPVIEPDRHGARSSWRV